MPKNYSYPLDLTWNTKEMTAVISFLTAVEEAYENRVKAEVVLEAYKAFKTVVSSKSQEKRLDRDFEKLSGYSTYRVLKAAQEKEKGFVSLGQ